MAQESGAAMNHEHEMDPDSMVSVDANDLNEIAVVSIEADIASIFPQPENVEHILHPLESQLVLRVQYHTASGREVELMYNEDSVEHMMYLIRQFVEGMKQDQ